MRIAYLSSLYRRVAAAGLRQCRMMSGSPSGSTITIAALDPIAFASWFTHALYPASEMRVPPDNLPHASRSGRLYATMTGTSCCWPAAIVTCLTSRISPDSPAAQMPEGVFATAHSSAACVGCPCALAVAEAANSGLPG